MKHRRALLTALGAALVIVIGLVLQDVQGWRMPVSASAVAPDVSARSLRSRRTLAALRRAGMQATRSPLVINEVMTLNPGTVLDERLTASDWVELYNRSDIPIALEGFGISDSRSASRRWTFPDVHLAPRTPLMVWCSGRDETSHPLTRTLRMVPTGHEPWSMKYDDRAPSGIVVRFKEGEKSAAPYTVAMNIPCDDNYIVTVFALNEKASPGSLRVSVDGLEAVALDVPADAQYRWSPIHNPASQDGSWSFGTGRHTIALRAAQGSVRVEQLACRNSHGEPPPAFLHSSFRLASSGESVILTDREGEILDYVTPPPMPLGESYQRIPDGADTFEIGPPSPGGTRIRPAPEIGAHPTFSESPITLHPPAAIDTIDWRYTLNGARPAPGDPRFPPNLVISQHTVLNVRGFVGNTPATDTATRQFWIGPLPNVLVLCIATEPSYLDYTDLGVFNRRKKRGRDWERRAHVLLFNGTSVAFDGLAGLRSHGWRHPDRNQNSFHINFRQSFGEDRLRRNPFNPSSDVRPRCVIADASGFGWADELGYDLARELGGTAPYAKPVLIFVNGRPYNVGTLVENVDESFFLEREGHTQFDVIKRKPRRLKMGTWDHYRQFHDYIRDEDNLARLTKDNVERFLDTDSLTSWMLTIILADASSGGTHITREAFQGYFYVDRTKSSAAAGMIAWDVDQGFREVDYNTLKGIRNESRFTTPVGTFRALLRNDPNYVQEFVRRAQDALNHVFRPNRRMHDLDRIAELYDRYAAHCAEGAALASHASGELREDPTWEDRLPGQRADWAQTFANARKVILERPEIVRRQIMEEFDLGTPFHVRVPGAVGLTLLIDGHNETLPFDGQYFPGSMLSLSVLPDGERGAPRFSVNGQQMPGDRLDIAVETDLIVDVAADREP